MWVSSPTSTRRSRGPRCGHHLVAGGPREALDVSRDEAAEEICSDGWRARSTGPRRSPCAGAPVATNSRRRSCPSRVSVVPEYDQRVPCHWWMRSGSRFASSPGASATTDSPPAARRTSACRSGRCRTAAPGTRPSGRGGGGAEAAAPGLRRRRRLRRDHHLGRRDDLRRGGSGTATGAGCEHPASIQPITQVIQPPSGLHDAGLPVRSAERRPNSGHGAVTGRAPAPGAPRRAACPSTAAATTAATPHGQHRPGRRGLGAGEEQELARSSPYFAGRPDQPTIRTGRVGHIGSAPSRRWWTVLRAAVRPRSGVVDRSSPGSTADTRDSHRFPTGFGRRHT